MASLPGMPGGSAPPAATTAVGTGPSAPLSSPDNTAKLPQEQAGYMELAGAQKDGQCSKVNVEGGVSLDLGCCNEFQPQDESVDKFCCGECKFGSEGQNGNEQNNTGGMTQEKSGADHPLQQLRAKPKRMGL